MALKSFNPYTASRRFITMLDKSELTKQTPEKSLVEPRSKSGGRNNTGRVTSRFISGGHKQAYRVIDFKRDKFGIPAVVAAIEYDPNRSARIALLNYADGEKRYIVYPVGLKVGAGTAPRETKGTTEGPGNRRGRREPRDSTEGPGNWRGRRDHGNDRRGRATGADVGNLTPVALSRTEHLSNRLANAARQASRSARRPSNRLARAA